MPLSLHGIGVSQGYVIGKPFIFQHDEPPLFLLEGRIIIADDLTPADTIQLQHQGISAFVTEYGGPLSHTALLARSLGIPAIVEVRNARRYLRDDELIVVDGHQGVVLANLDAYVLAHYRRKQQH